MITEPKTIHFSQRYWRAADAPPGDRTPEYLQGTPVVATVICSGCVSSFKISYSDFHEGCYEQVPEALGLECYWCDNE